MPPPPSDETAPTGRPRHAAGADALAFPGGAAAGLPGGRHRRPESLADLTRLRPVPAIPSQNRRSVEDRFQLGEFTEGFIELGFTEPALTDPARTDPALTDPARTDPALTNAALTDPARTDPARDPAVRSGWAGRRRAEALRRAQQRRHAASIAEAAGPRAAPERRAEQAPSRRPRTGGRGKHAAPHQVVVTVRALPGVHDAVVDGLPAAKRAADAVREWALYTGDKPPVTGTHRAPGTLPIESWLLVGRGRQQALLATVVAAGLALMMIPIQRHVSVNPITAASRSIVSIEGGNRARTASPPGKAKRQGSKPAPGKAAARPAPGQPAAPAAAPPASEEAPTITVPPGTGPAQSLRVTGSQAVALTFDDGPDVVQTPKILAMLDQYHVKATFCLVGQQVKKHPEIVRQIVAAGHTLCNHTWDHSLTIGKDTTTQIRADLERTNAAIRAAVPDAQIPFFRAPGGNFTHRLVSVAYGEQMTSLYWQVDPQDWDHRTDSDDTSHTDRVVADVRKYVKPGSIILSHDFNQPDTIVAYETLLPWLTENFKIGLPVPPPVPGEQTPDADSPPPASAENSPPPPAPQPSTSPTPASPPAS